MTSPLHPEKELVLHVVDYPARIVVLGVHPEGMEHAGDIGLKSHLPDLQGFFLLSDTLHGARVMQQFLAADELHPDHQYLIPGLMLVELERPAFSSQALAHAV